jgi:hypothetical protein
LFCLTEKTKRFALYQAGEEINEERGSRASMQLPKLEQVLQIQVSGSLSMPGFSVLLAPDKHSHPHSPKTTAIFEASRSPLKKFAGA